jgi:hypothetical protein
MSFFDMIFDILHRGMANGCSTIGGNGIIVLYELCLLLDLCVLSVVGSNKDVEMTLYILPIIIFKNSSAYIYLPTHSRGASTPNSRPAPLTTSGIPNIWIVSSYHMLRTYSSHTISTRVIHCSGHNFPGIMCG